MPSLAATVAPPSGCSPSAGLKRSEIRVGGVHFTESSAAHDLRKPLIPSHRFGRFDLRPQARLLLEDGRPVELGARAFDLLVTLVENRDRLVAKGELLDLVWPGVIVEENNLQVQVSALRKVLGQDAIKTLPGRGYRFGLEVGPAGNPVAANEVRSSDALPRPLTSFVGRESDLAEYARLLEHTRLLTLTGVGGCGKTRLAIELARSVLPLFPDGVWFVDLAPVAAPERVALTVATTLGVREEPDRSILDTVCARLRRQACAARARQLRAPRRRVRGVRRSFTRAYREYHGPCDQSRAARRRG